MTNPPMRQATPEHGDVPQPSARSRDAAAGARRSAARRAWLASRPLDGVDHRRRPERGNDVGQMLHVLHRSEEHTSELQSLMRISYAVFCLKKTKQHQRKDDDCNITCTRHT